MTSPTAFARSCFTKFNESSSDLSRCCTKSVGGLVNADCALEKFASKPSELMSPSVQTTGKANIHRIKEARRRYTLRGSPHEQNSWRDITSLAIAARATRRR